MNAPPLFGQLVEGAEELGHSDPRSHVMELARSDAPSDQSCKGVSMRPPANRG